MVLYIILGIFFYLILSHLIVYRFLKNRYMKNKKWDLNICCGSTNGLGINADVIERPVPNFVKVNDIYNLPFKDKEFENVLCSHTIEHVDNPEKFYKELKRVGKNVTLLIPPFWDLASLLHFTEHKWHFLTLSTKHTNSLPSKIKLPYWGFQKIFGQRIK